MKEVAKTKIVKVSDKAVGRLAKYWFRAELMHEFVHVMRKEYEFDFREMESAGDWWEFETYLCYWLSALFVVVEGFNKLKLRDAKVQRLFKEQVSYLKKMRHETYHFAIELDPGSSEMIGHLNWAEELHKATGDHLKKIVERKAKVERFMEKRAKTQR